MAGPTLGTLLIQRLDAALGTTLSQQTQIVNRATSDPVTHPSQAARPEPVSNTLVRDTRENVDRATLNARPGAGANIAGSGEAAAAGRGAGPNVTTSATTSLGLAARIILNLFASNTAGTAPVTARAPLLSTAPNAAPASTTPSAATSSASPSGTPSATQSGATGLNTQGLDSTTLLAQTLTRALTQSLQQSGLFYESHLKSMVSGQYRPGDLRQEPQAQIRHGNSRSEAGSAPSTGTQVQSAQTAQTASARGAAEPGASTPSTPATTSATAGSAAPASQGPAPQLIQQSLLTPGIDPATHGMVRQQLEALADQSIHWRGEAWPDAQMDWHIRRNPEHEHTSASGTDHDAPWQSKIQITLPRLGDITMDVRLAGKQVYVALQADEDTAPLLRRHTGELLSQMSDRQLELTAITFIEPEATGADAGAQLNASTESHTSDKPAPDVDPSAENAL